MAIADELAELTATKLAIKTAIEDAGVTVGSIPFSQYPEKVAQIPTAVGSPILILRSGSLYLADAGFTDGTDGELITTGVAEVLPSPDRTYAILRMTSTGAPRRFDLGTKEVTTLSTIPNITGGGMDFSPDGSLLALRLAAGGAGVYNTSDWAATAGFTNPTGTVTGLRFSPDGTKLAVGRSSSLLVMNTSDWSSSTVSGVSSSVDALTWAANSKRLAFTHSPHTAVRQYDVDAGTMLTDSDATTTTNGLSLAYVLDDTYILALADTAPGIRRINVTPTGAGFWGTGSVASGISLAVGANAGGMGVDSAGNLAFRSAAASSDSPQGFLFDRKQGRVVGLIAALQGASSPSGISVTPMY